MLTIGDVFGGLSHDFGKLFGGKAGSAIESGTRNIADGLFPNTGTNSQNWDSGNDNVAINTMNSMGGPFGEVTTGNIPLTRAGGWGSVVASSSCAVRGKHGNCVKNAALGTGPPPGFNSKNWSPSANSPLGKWASSGGMASWLGSDDPLSVFMAHNNKSQAHTQTKPQAHTHTTSQIQKHTKPRTQEYHLEFKPNEDTKGSSGTTHFKNKHK